MSARESILTLLDPILGRSSASYAHSLPIDTSFIRAHGILFGRLSTDDFEESKDAFLGQLDNHIGRVTAKWNEQGVFIAVTNIAGFFDYGSQDSPLRHIHESHARKIVSRKRKASESDISPSSVQTLRKLRESIARTGNHCVHDKHEYGPDINDPAHAFTLAHAKYRAYNLSCRPFVDLIEDEKGCKDPCSRATCLRLRIGSRRLSPLNSNNRFHYSPITMSPPLTDIPFIGTEFPPLQPPPKPSLYDAALLKVKRRGHDLSLAMYSHSIKETEKNDSIIEPCSTSNELLILCRKIQEFLSTCGKSISQELSENCLTIIRKASSLLLPVSHIAVVAVFIQGVMGLPTGQGRVVTSGIASSQPDGSSILMENLGNIVVSCASLVVPLLITVIAAVLTKILVRSKAEGKLAFGMLLAGCVFTATRPAQDADRLIILAVGLVYLLLALGFCKLVVVEHQLGKGFTSIVIAIGILTTIGVAQFQPIRDFWIGLTGLDSGFAISVGIPLSFYCCDLIVYITKAVQDHHRHRTNLPSPGSLESNNPVPLATVTNRTQQRRPLRQARSGRGLAGLQAHTGDEDGFADDEIDYRLASQITSLNLSLPSRRTARTRSLQANTRYC